MNSWTNSICTQTRTNCHNSVIFYPFLDPFYIVSFYRKGAKTSWTDSIATMSEGNGKGRADLFGQGGGSRELSGHL